MSDPELTPAAQQLVERWKRLMDILLQCSVAIEAGDWVLLNDEAGELSVAADEVSAAASALTRDETATDPAQIMRAIGERPSE